MEKEIIYLETETVKSQGKEYRNYFVRGKFERNGKEEEMKVILDVPTNDFGMYTVLDMVFNGAKKTQLYRKVIISKDMATQKKTTRYRYEVANEKGDLIGVVKPKGESNSALLNLLFNRLNADDVVEEEE